MANQAKIATTTTAITSSSPEQDTLPDRGLRRKRWQDLFQNYHWQVALLLYLLLSLAITHPLIFHLNDAGIGPYVRGDTSFFIGALWQFKQDLLAGHDPANTHYIYALLPSAPVLIHSYYNYGLGLLLQLVLSPLAAYNLLMFLTFSLSGLSMYLLAHEFYKSKVACFAAGFLFDFSTFHFLRASGHMGLTNLQVLPFYVWRVFVFYRRPNLKNALLAGVAVALPALTEPYFLPYFVLPFGVLFLLGKLLTDFKWFQNRRNLIWGGVVGFVVLLILLPAFSQYLKIDPDIVAAAEYASKYSTEGLSANLVAYFLPHNSNPFYGALTQPVFAQMDYGGEKAIFLGYVTLILSLIAFMFRGNRNKRNWFWVVLALLGIGLSFGPKLYIVGEPVIWWPFYNMVFDKPLLSSFRGPARLGILPLFAFSLLAAQALDSLKSRYVFNFKRETLFNVAVVGLLAVSLSEHILFSLPYPIDAVPDPALYHLLAADTSDSLLLDLPVNTACANNYYQTIHHKRLVTGCAPRFGYNMLNSVDNLPHILPLQQPGLRGVESALGGNISAETALAGDIYPQPLDFKTGLQENKVRYVVLHNDNDLAPDQLAAMRHYVEERLGSPFYDNSSEGLAAWRLDPISTVSSPDYRFKLGRGWQREVRVYDGQLERVVAQDGQLLIQASQAGPQTLSFKARTIYQPLTLEVRLNGSVVETRHFETPGVASQLQLSAIQLKAGDNTLEFHAVEGCALAQSFTPTSEDVRCYSFAIQQVTLN